MIQSKRFCNNWFSVLCSANYTYGIGGDACTRWYFSHRSSLRLLTWLMSASIWANNDGGNCDNLSCDFIYSLVTSLLVSYVLSFLLFCLLSCQSAAYYVSCSISRSTSTPQTFCTRLKCLTAKRPDHDTESLIALTGNMSACAIILRYKSREV